MKWWENRDGLILRHSRKAYRCAGDGSSFHRHAPDCPRTIPIGAEYVECVWESGPVQSGIRVTLECAAAHYRIEAWPRVEVQR